MGYYSCAETYFTHEVAGALDFHMDASPRCGANCSQPLFSAMGTYSSFLIAQRAVDIVEAHDPKAPLFLYLAFQDTHGPAEVVPAYRDRYNSTIPDLTRRTLAGKLSTVDGGLANVTAALKAKGMDDNLLLIFTADVRELALCFVGLLRAHSFAHVPRVPIRCFCAQHRTAAPSTRLFPALRMPLERTIGLW